MMIRTFLMTVCVLTSLATVGAASAQSVFLGSSASDPTATDPVTADVGQSATLYVWVAPAAAQTVTGFGLNVSSDLAGLSATGSTVFNPANPSLANDRWNNPVADGQLNSSALLLVELQNAVAIAGPSGISQPLAAAGLLGGTVVDGNVLLSSIELSLDNVGSYQLSLSSPTNDPFVGTGGVELFPDFAGLTVNVIPEPASLALLALGGLTLITRRRA